MYVSPKKTLIQTLILIFLNNLEGYKIKKHELV